MHARDASGRRVSLLNDESTSASLYQHDASPQSIAFHSAGSHAGASQPHHAAYGRSPSPFPHTPELLRSDSYDSQMSSSEPISPLTPMPMYDYGRAYMAGAADGRSPTYDDFITSDMRSYSVGGGSATKRPSALSSDSRSTSYEDDAAASPPSSSNPSDRDPRAGRRYPCRYRDTHGCDKTFTTSGHASRHSKIHTAEKAVQCTFPGCAKKFTRADNMKQHLETHYKDKSSRASAARPSLAASDRKSSSSGGSSSSSSSKSSSKSSRAAASSVSSSSSSTSSASSASYMATTAITPLPSPGLWEVRNGLDALALAVACQEGA